MPAYTKEVKAISRDTVSVKVFRDGHEVMFDWFHSPFWSLEKKFKLASAWGDKHIELLSRLEVIPEKSTA